MKNNLRKTIIALALSVAAIAATTGCGSSGAAAANTSNSAASAGGDQEAVNDGKTNIIYGKGNGPYTLLFEEAIIPILEEKGYTFEESELTLQYADEALADGDIDLSVEQHTAYMNAFNAAYNANLVALLPIPTVSAKIFSETHSSIDEIGEGMVIAIPQDEGNQARAFVMFQDLGWITLKEGTNYATATAGDIEENPYNLTFYEISSTYIPTTLSDYDFGVITGSVVANAGLDPSTALFSENLTENFWLQVVVRDEDKNSKWVSDLLEAYQSEEFLSWLEENNGPEFNNLWSIPEY